MILPWIIGFLTVVLVLISLLLILLILVQLPKKEAGLGTAFGGGTTDALFGAGAGNVLTKLTKYCAVSFFVITLTLSMLYMRQSRSSESALEKNLQSLEQQEIQNNLQQPSTSVPPLDTNALREVTNAVQQMTNAPADATPLLTPNENPTPGAANTPEAPATPSETPPDNATPPQDN